MHSRVYWTYCGPCIVIYSYNKTNEKHQFVKFILEIEPLHVSDSISVHYQESSTVNTAMVYVIQVTLTAC